MPYFSCIFSDYDNPDMSPGIDYIGKTISSFLTLCILMDFPIQINTIRVGLSIICFKGSQVRIS